MKWLFLLLVVVAYCYFLNAQFKAITSSKSVKEEDPNCPPHKWKQREDIDFLQCERCSIFPGVHYDE